MDHYTLTLAREMARRNGMKLTTRHLDILTWVSRYYARHRVGPLYQNITKRTGAGKGEIDTLFPHGLASVYAWAGIPIHSPQDPCSHIPTIAVRHPRTVYFDHSATTPLRPEAASLMQRYNQSDLGFANPSSGSPAGRAAHRMIQKSRAALADALSTTADHIVFTGGGSEANNLAIKGWAFQNWERKGHIITSRIAHSSILEPIRWLETMGFEATYLLPDAEGLITAESIQSVLKPHTALVALLAANNEIGTINPISEIACLCKEYDLALHVDAVQAFGRLPLAPQALGIQSLSISGHKIYGPKGVGALYIAPEFQLQPLIHGGGQERGLRAGTENVSGIGALGVAARLMSHESAAEVERLKALRDDLLRRLNRVEPGMRLNGHEKKRLAHHLNVSFPGVTSGGLLLALAQIGISVSAGSACSAGKEEASHVLQAMGVDGGQFGTIRITLGRETVKDDIDYFIEYLPHVLKALREAPEEHTAQ